MEKKLTMLLASLFLVLGGAFAQTTVNGTVVSEDGNEPVIGATVQVVGASNVGTVTDVDGQFTITCPEGKNVLRISYLGMQPIEVIARKNLRVVLRDDSNDLDEVIVTGYGNVKKSSFTGAAATINTEALSDVPTVSLEDKLAGGVPGVSISTTSGAPGAVSSIRIRGMGSINAGNDPLIVIDGVPMVSGDINPVGAGGYNDAGTNSLSTLNSNDIESMTVIKDAAAASLYGSRAANGVIVITTKSGKKGKTNVEFRSDWGFSNAAVDYRPQLSGDERRNLLIKGLENYLMYGEGAPADVAREFALENIDAFAPIPEGGYTNWKDLLFKTGHHQNYQVSVNGGSDNTQFYSSISYVKQDGILTNQGMERFTGNANVSHKFGRFTVRLSTMFSKVNQSLANEKTSFDGTIANYAFFQSPSDVPFFEDGSFNREIGFTGVNPLYEYLHSSDRTRINRMMNTLQLTYNIWDNLNISEKVSYDFSSNSEDVLWDKYSNNASNYGGLLQRFGSRFSQLNTQTQLTYIKSFGNHNIDALAGFETEDFNFISEYMSGLDYPGELYEIANAGETDSETSKSGYRMTSFIGRLNYNYDNKYYAGLSYRRDGTSRLAKENRWGDFWSVSGAWRFTGESFMEGIKNTLTDGKLRISYGVNGTQPSGYYGYMNLYRYGVMYNGSSGMAIIGVGNPNLKWEKNHAFNVGLDLTFWNRLTFGIDFYTRTTKDLIYDLPISAVPGYYSTDDDGNPIIAAAQNVGSLKNTGIEVTINSVNIQKPDFEWTTQLNFGHNHNKVAKLDGEMEEIIDGPMIHRVGETYWSYYLYEYAGVDPETGQESYYINDPDAKPGKERATTIDSGEANKVIVGNHEPVIEGGLSNNIRWKFIDFSFTMTFSLGADAYDWATWQHCNGGAYLYYGAVPSYYDIDKMWTGPGDTQCTQPKFQYGSDRIASSRWLMPADYLRVKNLTVGFTAPRQWTSRIGVSKARAYFSASNLLTFKSKDLFVDPEMPVHGACTFETPALRTFTFGIELGF
ncbi:MAG: TonB-dependent receptor [Prevotella sp.]|nr:TonB-dependent receptor [Prevotella sp.]